MQQKNNFENLKNWCNANQGLLTLLGLIVAIIAAIPFNKIDFSFAHSLWDKCVLILTYKLQIPIYLFIVVVVLSLFYLLRLRKRYLSSSYTLKFLKGTWKCEWTIIGSNPGSEITKISEDGKYIINNDHWFDITEFKFDSTKKQITFYKTAVKENDQRKLPNTLNIINNECLEGTENNYKIKYTKLSD